MRSFTIDNTKMYGMLWLTFTDTLCSKTGSFRFQSGAIVKCPFFEDPNSLYFVRASHSWGKENLSRPQVDILKKGNFLPFFVRVAPTYPKFTKSLTLRPGDAGFSLRVSYYKSHPLRKIPVGEKTRLRPNSGAKRLDKAFFKGPIERRTDFQTERTTVDS